MAFKMKKPTFFNNTKQSALKQSDTAKVIKETKGTAKDFSNVTKTGKIIKEAKIIPQVTKFMKSPVGATAGKAGTVVSIAAPFVEHGLKQYKYKKENPNSEYDYYSQDPKYRGEALGGKGIDIETGLPKMSLAESHVLSGDKEGGGIFGFGDIIFPKAKKEYKTKLDEALKNKLITQEKYKEAIKNYNL